MSIKDEVDRILADKRMTRHEYEHFILNVLEDGKISPEENEQVTRLKELVENKEIVVE